MLLEQVYYSGYVFLGPSPTIYGSPHMYLLYKIEELSSSILYSKYGFKNIVTIQRGKGQKPTHHSVYLIFANLIQTASPFVMHIWVVLIPIWNDLM